MLDKEYGFIDSDIQVAEKEIVQYELSPHLRKYQKNIVNQALNDGCYGIFSDTGTGKTVMGLEIATHYKKTLILCPLSVIETAWIDDCNKFYPNTKIINVWSNSKQNRIKLLNTPADIYVMNYDRFNSKSEGISSKILSEFNNGITSPCYFCSLPP